MKSQRWFRWWLDAVKQQAITWANVGPDLCHHKASFRHNELTWSHLYDFVMEHLTFQIPVLHMDTTQIESALFPQMA